MLSKYKDMILGTRVTGTDREGNRYNLNVLESQNDLYRNEHQILVSLPFSPDHQIWEELRNDKTE
jgi:hypothetical protein